MRGKGVQHFVRNGPPEDHPRGCGEKKPKSRTATTSEGSPPRVRGKASESLSYSRHVWITPAGAGKRVFVAAKSFQTWDHPRGCGEKLAESAKYSLALGITPAGAGKSCSLRPSGPGSRDHPRGCGEKLLRSSCSAVHLGSPPRVRGKVSGVRENLERMGITPAGAGKRPRRPRLRCRSGDHPRGCGEKKIWNVRCVTPWGSPPRVRGKDAS